MANNGVILDSDIIIWWLRGHEDYHVKLKALLEKYLLYATPVSVAEVWGGARPKEEARIKNFFSSIDVLVINDEIGESAGHFISKYNRSHSVELSDSLIAACAIHYDCKLWTLNHKHYPMLKKDNLI